MREFSWTSSKVHLAGIDGGGSKTRAVVTDLSFDPIGKAERGPSNPLQIGAEAAAEAVMDALDAACRAAHLHRDTLAAVGIGLAGVRHPRHHRAMQRALEERWGEGPPWLLVPDAEIALMGATAGEPGVVVIAGTGSVACGMNARGETATSGGWGPAFGDEGSGTDIARRALMAAAADFDGRGEPTALTPEICRWFHITNPAELLTIIYSSARPMAPPAIAPLAEIVVRVAEQGDVVAQMILREAGRELGRAAAAVIRRLRMERDAFPVAYTGGVFRAGSLILTPLRAMIQSIAPRARIVRPLHPPAVGAAILAGRRLFQATPQFAAS